MDAKTRLVERACAEADMRARLIDMRTLALVVAVRAARGQALPAQDRPAAAPARSAAR